MENQNVKRGCGRAPIYQTEEEKNKLLKNQKLVICSIKSGTAIYVIIISTSRLLESSAI